MQTTIGELLQRATTLHRQGALGDAESLYKSILEFRPDHPDANHNLGVLKVTSGSIADALPLLKRALDANPQIEQFWFSYIEALVSAECFDDAMILFENAKQSLAPPRPSMHLRHVCAVSLNFPRLSRLCQPGCRISARWA